MKLENFLDEKKEVNDLMLRKLKEGKASIFVPDPDIYQDRSTQYLPSTLPVFYNPQMKLNRDISIVSLLAYKTKYTPKNLTYMEGLAATGIRGFRISKEIDENIDILLNDKNPLATKLMNYNKSLIQNTQKKKHIKIFNCDFNFLCHKLNSKGKNIDVIEIDPFGTPTPFLHAAISSLNPKNALLLISATDLTVFHGKYPNVALRKYGSKIIETPFSKEIGVRALLYAVDRIAGNFNRYITPLFGFFFDNFLKIAVLVKEGKKEANKIDEKVGWLNFRENSNSFHIKKGFIPRNRKPQKHSPKAQSKTKTAGPLWIEPIFDKTFAESMLSSLKSLSIKPPNSFQLRRSLERELQGREIPFYYDLNSICQRLKLPPPKVNTIVQKIRTENYEAYRTHFEPTAIRTNAKLPLIEEKVKKTVKQRKS